MAALLIGLATPVLVAHTLHRQYTQALSDAETRASNTTRVLEQHAARTLESTDAYLRAVVALVGPRAGNVAPEVVHAALREQLTRSRHLINLTIFDRNGRAVFEAGAYPARPLDLTDHDYFQVLRDTPGAGLVVGQVVTGHLTSGYVIPLARRMENLDGSFAGVVQALLDPDAFQSVYDAIDNGPGGTLILWRSDGTLLVRSPTMPEVISKNYASGENYRRHVLPRDTKPFWSRGSTDGVERVIAFGFLDDYLLYVSAAVGRADALAEWRSSAITQVSVAGGLTLVLVLALVLLARELERRQAADATIRTSEARHREVLNTAHDAFVAIDDSGKITAWNTAAEATFGWSVAEAIGRPLAETIIPDLERSAYRSGMARFRKTRKTSVLGKRLELIALRKDGSAFPIEMTISVTEVGGALAFNAFIRDISDRKVRERAILESEARYRLLAENTTDVIIWSDLDTTRRYVSPAAKAVLGYEPEELVGTRPLDFVHPDDVEAYRCVLDDLTSGRIEQAVTCQRYQRKDGAWIWIEVSFSVTRDPESGRGSGYVASLRDVTLRKQAEQQIAHMAVHDTLTGLPNRALFRDRLGREIARADRDGNGYAVLACDLDGFKAVNDALGHPAGDALLCTLAARLKTIVRNSDTVARLGGDEFALILSGLDQPQAASATAQRVIEAVAQPFDLNGHIASVGISVGIAVGPQDGHEPDDLYKNADIALYRAKAAGRNTFRFYEPGMETTAAAGLGLELDLRQAVQRGGFALHYQPIVNATTETVTGFEALMRWQHPLRGPISPAEFIPIAEETGLIVALGSWALHEACREATSWPSDIKVAVNISMVQFAQPGLDQTIMMALSASGLPAHRLELEITESVLMEDAEGASDCLHRLRALGVRIALDDFGTGYSSLSYLRRFPFDKIKIDCSFIRDIANPDTAAIVRAVVGIGERLGAEITAECVETHEQLEQVRQEGCTEVQGYLFSRPLPAADALRFTRIRASKAA